MAIIEKRLSQFAPDTSERTYYTVPAGTAVILTNIVVANSSSSPVTLALSLVPAGGVPGNANRLIPGTTIPGNTMIPLDLSSVMAAGDFITAVAGGTGLAVYISGMERGGINAVSTGTLIRGTRRYRTTLWARANFR